MRISTNNVGWVEKLYGNAGRVRSVVDYPKRSVPSPAVWPGPYPTPYPPPSPSGGGEWQELLVGPSTGSIELGPGLYRIGNPGNVAFGSDVSVRVNPAVTHRSLYLRAGEYVFVYVDQRGRWSVVSS
ncbi:unnamed protein product [marine sediment metagenome]|uniref:Uncharacterized protein n=1 Tax=marine sediment metagenome TaxID=412755 RepID=X0Y2V6_9ZZZZ